MTCRRKPGTASARRTRRIGFAERFGDSVGIAVVNNTAIAVDIGAEAVCAGGPGVVAASVRALDAAVAELGA
ncbi:MAG: hypothetical protein QOH72_5463 [Solirubrobacteraceae bacterium]|nr:hypothetical protein [Solirubrobacteraceae bacterium]